MWSGRAVDGPTFYALLCADDKFCAQLGRATLASGRLETALKRYLIESAPHVEVAHRTLGQLVAIASKQQLLTRMVPALALLCNQRNYVAHNIHALLSGLIEETILEGSNLIDSDVSTYTDRASELTDNLNGLAEILERNCT